jgi:hypothetical protein
VAGSAAARWVCPPFFHRTLVLAGRNRLYVAAYCTVCILHESNSRDPRPSHGGVDRVKPEVAQQDALV